MHVLIFPSLLFLFRYLSTHVELCFSFYYIGISFTICIYMIYIYKNCLDSWSKRNCEIWREVAVNKCLLNWELINRGFFSLYLSLTEISNNICIVKLCEHTCTAYIPLIITHWCQPRQRPNLSHFRRNQIILFIYGVAWRRIIYYHIQLFASTSPRFVCLPTCRGHIGSLYLMQKHSLQTAVQRSYSRSPMPKMSNQL